MSRDNVSPKATGVRPKYNCDGPTLRRLIRASLRWLETNRDHVNTLNVFPVPDGDTGTNMLLTMRSAYRRIENSETEAHAGKIIQEVAQGALMGARGNSGVILSQVWRGLARSLKDRPAFSAQELAAALKEASDTAYKGVMRPVEGTILTVIREGAEEAVDAAAKSRDLYFVLERVLERCQQALRRTPDLLPVLKQAGVVDSGGQGLVYLLEGMVRYAHGELREDEMPAIETTPVVPSPQLAQTLAQPEGGRLAYPYDVQFILMGQNLNVLEVRQRLDAMGDSTVVVGDERLIKVHVHVQDPGQALSYGVSLGQLTDVVVENMQLQMEALVENSSAPADEPEPEPILQPGQVGVVAVTPGGGLKRIFHSLGVSQVVDGGQTNNPSTEEIFQAIQDVPTDKVIVLPNNKNIILAAEAARDLSTKQVVVVPTRTTPQGMSVLLAYNPDGNLDEVAAAMHTAAANVVSGEITRATRSVNLNGVNVAEGQLIGLVDGRLCAAGHDMADVVTQTLHQMGIAQREIVTFYYGQDVAATAAEAMAQQVRQQYPNVEVELHWGGQPHYYYLIGAE